MSLTERINNPDRREADLAPIVERRGGTERRIPAWVARLPKNAKDLTERRAA